MKNLFLAVLAMLSFLLLAGCRREDIREMTVAMPGLMERHRSEIEKTLARYEGVDLGSFVWDFRRKTLTLKYDSMKIAQSNIRYAIDEKGIKVEFPVKTDDHAGY